MRITLFLLFACVCVLTIFVWTNVTNGIRPLPFDHTDTTTDLAQSQIRPGLNVDNLPLVRIDYGGFRPSTNVGTDNDDNDHGTADLNARRQACLTRGAYLGPENDEVDCAAYCNVAPDEAKYVYVGGEQASRVIRSRVRTKPGAYCMPTLAATCNRNTSLVVYSIDGWSCLPVTDAFAGEGGNRIVVCDGSLLDRALGVIHRVHIPSNLMFGNVYTDRTSDGRFRFECPPSAKDAIGNPYISSPLNRLHIIRNWCVADIPYAANGRPDFLTATCVCDRPLHNDPRTGQCVTCYPRYDLNLHTFSVRQRPCFSFRDDYESFERTVQRLEENDDNNDAGEERRPTLFPCGWNVVGGSPSEYTLPRCLEYFAGIHKPPLMSPSTLITIDELRR